MSEEEVWLLQAEHDLQAAEHNLRGGFLDHCLICCQQATEKALKALYIAKHRKAPPRMHDIQDLARAVELETSIPGQLVALTRWYLEARYPDVADVPPFQKLDVETAEAALAATRAFLGDARRRLDE